MDHPMTTFPSCECIAKRGLASEFRRSLPELRCLYPLCPIRPQSLQELTMSQFDLPWLLIAANFAPVVDIERDSPTRIAQCRALLEQWSITTFPSCECIAKRGQASEFRRSLPELRCLYPLCPVDAPALPPGVDDAAI
jgi:hypothetical protein